MNKYKVKWFDGLDWRYKEMELLANSFWQVLDYMNSNFEYRTITTRKKENNYVAIEEDSLEVVIIESNIKMPYVLREN